LGLTPSDLLVIIEGGNIPALKWRRFPRVDGDYYDFFKDRWDGIHFIPKKRIQLLGFGVMAHFHKKSFTLTFKYGIFGKQES